MPSEFTCLSKRMNSAQSRSTVSTTTAPYSWHILLPGLTIFFPPRAFDQNALRVTEGANDWFDLAFIER